MNHVAFRFPAQSLGFEAADMALKLVPDGVKVHLMDYKSVLSVDEHNLLCKKLVTTFESSVATLAADAPRTVSLDRHHCSNLFLV